MSWIILSLLAPLFLAMASTVDDYMSHHAFKTQPMQYVFSGAACLLVPAGLIFAFYPEARAVPSVQALLLMGVGAVFMTGFISLYIAAMRRSGATAVIPAFQSVAAFVFLGGFVFFGETVTLYKMAACVAVIAAAAGINWDFKLQKFPVASLLLMLAAAFGAALYNLCARYFTQDFDALAILAWVWLGFGGLGGFVLLVSPQRRRDIVQTVKKDPRRVSGGLAAQGVLQALAEICIVSALAIAPAAGLVQTIGGIQPAFIFIFYAILGFAMPSSYSKIKADRALAWKLACLAVMFAGVAILSMSSES